MGLPSRRPPAAADRSANLTTALPGGAAEATTHAPGEVDVAGLVVRDAAAGLADPMSRAETIRAVGTASFVELAGRVLDLRISRHRLVWEALVATTEPDKAPEGTTAANRAQPPETEDPNEPSAETPRICDDGNVTPRESA